MVGSKKSTHTFLSSSIVVVNEGSGGSGCKKKVSRRQIAPSSAALRKPITTLASKGRNREGQTSLELSSNSSKNVFRCLVVVLASILSLLYNWCFNSFKESITTYETSRKWINVENKKKMNLKESIFKGLLVSCKIWIFAPKIGQVFY